MWTEPGPCPLSHCRGSLQCWTVLRRCKLALPCGGLRQRSRGRCEEEGGRLLQQRLSNAFSNLQVYCSPHIILHF